MVNCKVLPTTDSVTREDAEMGVQPQTRLMVVVTEELVEIL